uniref:Erv25 protein n=1 Tax=Colletotrichum fructicola (strain Nara gc5) TaxID=1213859 RepID=L2G4S0_COLFN
MAATRSLLRYVCGLVLLACCAQALRFDLHATGSHEGKKERCIRNFVARDTLVVVTATVDGHKAAWSSTCTDAVGNDYGKPKDIAGGEKRVVFTSHADAAFDVCFENLLTGSDPSHNSRPQWLHEPPHRIGADAKDWNAIQATEKLKPVEAELRRIDELVSEINTEMDYLRAREHKLRDTNESTNTRVKWFGIGTTMILVGLWGWQIMYLRAYFRSKHLI